MLYMTLFVHACTQIYTHILQVITHVFIMMPDDEIRPGRLDQHHFVSHYADWMVLLFAHTVYWHMCVCIYLSIYILFIYDNICYIMIDVVSECSVQCCMICTHTHCINKHACRHADVRTLHTCHYNTSHYIADMLYVAYKCIQYSCDIHYIACITLHYIMYITYTTCFLLASHGIL